MSDLLAFSMLVACVDQTDNSENRATSINHSAQAESEREESGNTDWRYSPTFTNKDAFYSIVGDSVLAALLVVSAMLIPKISWLRRDLFLNTSKRHPFPPRPKGKRVHKTRKGGHSEVTNWMSVSMKT